MERLIKNYRAHFYVGCEGCSIGERAETGNWIFIGLSIVQGRVRTGPNAVSSKGVLRSHEHVRIAEYIAQRPFLGYPSLWEFTDANFFLKQTRWDLGSNSHLKCREMVRSIPPLLEHERSFLLRNSPCRSRHPALSLTISF